MSTSPVADSAAAAEVRLHRFFFGPGECHATPKMPEFIGGPGVSRAVPLGKNIFYFVITNCFFGKKSNCFT